MANVELPMDLPGCEQDHDHAHADRPKKRHQVSKACQHCALSHLSCSETLPCDRCVKKGLVCEERPRKRRAIRTQEISRFDPADQDNDLAPRARAAPRKIHGKRRKSDQDGEYTPDSFHFNPNDQLSFELPVFPPFFAIPPISGSMSNITPTSASPRSAAHSDSISEDGGVHHPVKAESNDLDSLVSAALAASDEEMAEHDASVPSPAAVVSQPVAFDAQQQQLAQMMQWQMPMVQYAPAQAYPHMMPMQIPMVPVQWRMQGQLMAPVALPVNAMVRDLLGAIQTRLQYEHGLQPTDRVMLFVSSQQQRFPIDEQTNPNLPLHLLGFNEPTTVLDVTKFSS